MLLSIRKSKLNMASIGQKLRNLYDIPRHTTRTHVERSACESAFLGHGRIEFLTKSGSPFVKVFLSSHFSFSFIFPLHLLSPLIQLHSIFRIIFCQHLPLLSILTLLVNTLFTYLYPLDAKFYFFQH